MRNVEFLENRRLMAGTLLRVGSVTADNRGEVIIQLSERATGVKGAAVQLFTAGTDGQLFTNDDVRQTARITYSANKKQIKLTANLPKDTAYRIKLDGKSRIKAEDDGTLLDGNFSGTLASGDGRAGGNFEAVFRRDTSSTPTVKIRTSEGDVLMKMRGDVAPIAAANFLSYANSGRYDNTFLTRRLPGNSFVLQGGGMQITGSAGTYQDVTVTTKDSAITDESALPNRLSNIRGTVSFAKNAPDSATIHFFFNMADNSSLDSPTRNDGGFTPFAEVQGIESFAVLDRIDTKPIANLSLQIGIQGATAGADVANTPVNDVTLATGTINPFRDLIVFYRTAVLVKMSAKS